MFSIGVFPHLDGLRLEDVVFFVKKVNLLVSALGDTAACPRCSQISDRVHSRHWRTLHDLPWADVAVVLRLRVRRFCCANPDCSQKIFSERFPGLAGVRARRTDVQKAALEHLGFSLGGSAAARLGERIGLVGSRSTILRLIYLAPMPIADAPVVVGVDDWAKRKGQRYGTVVVDLEKRKAIDLLPDRTSEALAAWLREHPSVEIVSRDRAGNYAEGARQGAPQAVQIADRFHLLSNVGDALERVLCRKHTCLKEAAHALDRAAAETGQAGDKILAPPSAAETGDRMPKHEQMKQAHRARRLERYEAVIALHRQGLSQREIGRQLGLSRITVRRYISADGFPERASRPKRPTNLTPYEPYLRERWTAGCRNAGLLWREIRERGFTGSASSVRLFLAAWRTVPGKGGRTPRNGQADNGSSAAPVVQPTRPLSPRQARWLLLRSIEDLDDGERAHRDQLLLTSEELRTAWSLADDFGRIVRKRDRPPLGSWLKTAQSSGVREFRDFAIVLRRDLPAVEAALIDDWSNGQTEGQINRLKTLKRQMYGRASIELLKRRFVMAA